MKKQLQYLSIVLLLFLLNIGAFAQAPSIAYNPSSYNFTLSTNIGTITPTNSGGNVPATVYGTVSTYSGISGTASAVNSTIPLSTYNNPRSIAFDYTHNLIYVADALNDVIRKIDMSANTVTTYAGAVLTTGTTDGPVGTARFNQPYAISYDGTNTLYIAELGNNAIRKINTSTNTVSTISAGAITVTQPVGIVYDPLNALVYVSNYGRNNILKISNLSGTPAVAVFAGSNTTGTSGTTDGTGTNARFNGPNGLAIDASGNVYVADQTNGSIRVITSAGVSSTLATGFSNTRALDVDLSGNVYVTDDSNKINMVDASGTVTVVAGSGGTGSANGVGTAASFNACRGITVNKSTGDIYVCDYGNHLIRKIIGTGYTISATLSTGLSFSVTTGVITGTPSVRFAVTTYTVIGYNASGSSSTTITLSCGRTLDWDGSTNSRWETASNWTPANTPTAADNVQIGVVTYGGNQPTINATTGNVIVNSITFGSAKAATNLTVTTSSLTVNDNITVKAGAVSTISGTGSLNMAPGSILSLLTTGKLALSLSGGFTLKSDATGSASIGPILTPANFTGTNVTSAKVERYVTGGSSTYRGYRLMSSPVYVSGVSPHVYNLDYIKASSWVTGAAGNGFDKTGNPTLYLFREDQAPSNASYGAGNWPGVSKITNAPTYNLYLNSVATNINLTPGNGFLFFFRGDRAVATVTAETTTTYVPTSTTFTATGALNIGNITVSDWYNSGSTNLGYTSATANSTVRGYNLVGNPYPSNIDWDQFSSTVSSNGIYGPNVSNTVYVLDPVSHNYGAYTAGSGVPGTNNATNVIASGQGFFVRALGSSLPNPQLIFSESAKTSSQVIAPNLLLGTPVSANNNSYMHLKLAKDNLNTDETLFFFDNASGTNYKQGADALYKIGNGYVSLASRSSDHIDLAIKSIALPKQQGISLGLDVNAKSDGIYSLSLKDIVSVPRIYDIWLMDAYKRDSVDLRANKTYSFNIFKADTNSFGSNRFSLVIRQNPGFAYHLLNFTASKVSNARQVVIAWVTENEQNYTNFTVERSIDGGKTFDVLGGLQGSAAGTYSLLDKNPVSGQNLYRLKQEDINNSISYTKPQTVQYSDLSNNIAGKYINIYPNPVGATINLSITTPTNEAASYNIKIMNSSGTVVKEITSTQPSWQGSVNNLHPGTYVMRVTNTKTQSFVGENKFVKL